MILDYHAIIIGLHIEESPIECPLLWLKEAVAVATPGVRIIEVDAAKVSSHG